MTDPLPDVARRDFATCEKCGHSEPTIAYRRDTMACPRLGEAHYGEHFDLTCQRCGFRWTEKVAAPESEGSTR